MPTALLLLLMACGSDSGSDSGTLDGGSPDGGGADGGASADGGAGDGGADGGSGDGGSGDPSFGADVWPLLQPRCLDCHSYWGTSSEQLLSLLTSDVYDPPLVVPGDPDGSALVLKLEDAPPEGERMPLHVEPFDAAELASLRDWIDRGAPEAEVEVAFGVAWRSTEHRCQMCHADWETGGLYQHLMTSSVGKYALVVPGDADGSLLVQKVDGSTPPLGAPMPLVFDYLDDAELQTVRAWIEAGALP